MLLHKTALAHSALQAGSSAGLSLAERRVLIVVDGKRTLDDVVALLGPDSLPLLDRLRKDGYLQQASVHTASAHTGSGMGGALTGLLRATADALQARSEQARAGNARATPAAQPAMQEARAAPATSTPVVQPTHAASGNPRGQRRSLVAAKMYLIDMLQLQRHPDAVEHKARIQFASGDDALLDAILDGLRALHRLTNASYGQRIVARLGEALPEELLPALEQAVAALHAPPAEAAPGNTPQLKLVSG